MKHRRHRPTATRPSQLRIEQVIATDTAADTARPPRRRYSTLKLPHERDESTHRPEKPNAMIDQGARDVEAGRLDTDCYGAVGSRFDRRRRR